MLALPAVLDADLNTWIVGGDHGFAEAQLEQLRVHPDSAVVLGLLGTEVNLAKGRRIVDDFGRSVPLTDGAVSVGNSEWLSGTPNVYGRYFILDLGVDRAITRIRILAGASALAQPEYFIRGYRIEAATQDAADIWRPLAEQRSNFVLNIDTRADSTWRVVNDAGEALPRRGRFVRLTLIRQDRSNWVAIGDVEVYGSGWVEQGALVQRFTSPVPVNVGRVRWQGTSPVGTTLALQFRGSAAGASWINWDETDPDLLSGSLFRGREPVQAVELRATLSSTSAYLTPQLQAVEVEYDPVLVAHDVQGWVEPDTAIRAERSRVTYHAMVDVRNTDYGVDLLRLSGLPLEVLSVRVDGAPLSADEELGAGYRWRTNPSAGETVVELASGEMLTGLRQVDMDVAGYFMQQSTGIRLAVGSRSQAARDGFTNWQNGYPAEGSAWLVYATGTLPELIGEVVVTPRPFSPFASQSATFRFVVGHLQGPAEISVELFTLSGQRIRRLSQRGQARQYTFAWDGRDDAGKVVDPGLCLFEIRVEAGHHTASRRGALAVAY